MRSFLVYLLTKDTYMSKMGPKMGKSGRAMKRSKTHSKRSRG